MDDELFLRRLTELTEWHRPMLGPSGGTSVIKRRGRPPEDPELLAEIQEEQARIQQAEREPNPHVGPRILKILHKPSDCEACDRRLTEPRRVEIKKMDMDVPIWRHRCLNCNRYRNPETGQWDLEGARAHATYGNLVRKFRYQQKISGSR